MKISYVTTAAASNKCDLLIVPAFEGASGLSNYSYGKALGESLISGVFKGEAGQVAVCASPKGVSAKAVAVIGLGKSKDFSMQTLRNGVSAAVRHPAIIEAKAKSGCFDTTVILNQLTSKKDVSTPGGDKKSGVAKSYAEWVGQAVAEGAALGAYAYTELLGTNEKKKETLARISTLAIASDKGSSAAVKAGAANGLAISNAVNLCRDLCNKPNSHLRPGQLAAAATAAAKGVTGLSCKVLNKAELKKLKMGSLLSVNAGSGEGDSAARLICLEYKGGKKSDAPLCFVGKGLTFDTGGYSLKPAASMLGMKWDMGGAATVLGATVAIAAMKLPINLVCVIPTTENLVNENATKPGDVVKSMSGITIEVNNTDAEGRLILADALTYAQKNYKPDTIVDAATLTGAILIGLGDQFFGVMTNDDGVADELARATSDANELSWRLPLPAEYDKYLESDIADVSNIGGRMAGSITAGLFLQRFIDEGQKWAHLDIAGVANNEGKQAGVAPPKGGTGTGVRTLVAMARNRCGK